MTISIEYETELPLEVDYERIINDVVLAALDYEECPYEAEVSVTITDNESIQEINRQFRQIDRPTDVLSFPMVEYEEPGNFDYVEEDLDCFNPETGELLLGDIVLSVEKIKEQAAQYGHSMERELAFLVAHSMLHLMGYDHMQEEERLEMERRQEEILQELGITREIKDK
ncbi:MAG: rRNA maturation RNase YbeY [Lachnospiraceae bacterium]